MTHVNRARTAAILRTQCDDRRRYTRFGQHDMLVRVGSTLAKVHDLSVGGMRMPRIDAKEGSPITLTLMPTVNGRVELNRSHMVHGEVVGHAGQHTHIRFARLSYTLAKFVIQHLADRTGVQPYIFR